MLDAVDIVERAGSGDELNLKYVRLRNGRIVFADADAPNPPDHKDMVPRSEEAISAAYAKVRMLDRVEVFVYFRSMTLSLDPADDDDLSIQRVLEDARRE